MFVGWETNKCPYFIYSFDGISFKNPKSFVYFISNGQFVKIGYTNNLEKRMEDLQVGSPYELRLICAVPFENSLYAQKAENILHKQYEVFFVRGEWYNILGYIRCDLFARCFSPSLFLFDVEKENTTLLFSILLRVADQKTKNISYKELRERYGQQIFCGKQPKKCLDGLQSALHKNGVFVKTGKTVKYNGKTENGFSVYRK